ncbi:MFS transporter [Clostridium sp. YIM B02555]|uniref:MFS transporter n=1 Tax=Clostridium sp. YIM B02555 TaxID=2911968 RepID=UPI001EEEF772|nr:MFS transporter [Clostridium sp. YIM B02555]
MSNKENNVVLEDDVAIYLEPSKRKIVAIALLVSVFGCNFSFRAFGIALPHIIAGWDAMQLYTLGATLMTVAMTIATVIAARVAPKTGLKQTIIVGLSIILLCNMLTLKAPNMLIFVILRVLTGVGNGIVCGQIAASMNKIWPSNQRGTWIGILGIFQSLTSVIGPTLSGMLVDNFGWQSTYFTISAFQIIGLIMFVTLCPRDTRDRFYEPVPFDVAGTVFFTILITSIVIVCSYGNSLGWTNIKMIIGLLIAIIAMIGLVIAENKAGAGSLLPWDLFKNDLNFVKIFLISIFISLPGMAQVYFMPLYLQKVAQTSAIVSGVPFTILSIASLIASPVAAKIIEKTGKAKLVMMICVVMMTVPTFIYGVWIYPEVGMSNLPIIYGLSFLYGLGYILTMTLPYIACAKYLPEKSIGVGTANVYMGITLGSSVGLAFLQAVFNSLSTSVNMNAGIKAAFVCSAISGALTIILAFTLKKVK